MLFMVQRHIEHAGAGIRPNFTPRTPTRFVADTYRREVRAYRQQVGKLSRVLNLILYKFSLESLRNVSSYFTFS